jgi:XTP/dITP diphosphohydrolase
VLAQDKSIRLVVASSNEGKLREFRALGASAGASLDLDLALLPNFDALPVFDEAAPTFGENAVGKALHYSRFSSELVMADDSGLVVPALGGAPGVRSARYGGPGASDGDRTNKLLREMQGKRGADRRAQFVCVIALAQMGRARGVFSAFAEGELTEAPAGQAGFGYDPIFFFPALGKTFAEISREEKNQYSHRGKAFRRALDFLVSRA